MKLTNVLLATALIVVPAAAFAAPARFCPQEIHQRKVNQQDRIAQGVRSGQMTPHETARTERQERGINREERGMRAQDNGHLTAQDRRTVNHQQNVESRRIYNDKHNGHTGF